VLYKSERAEFHISATIQEGKRPEDQDGESMPQEIDEKRNQKVRRSDAIVSTVYY